MEDIREALAAAPNKLRQFIDDIDPWAARSFKKWAVGRASEVRADPTKSIDDVHDAAELARRGERALALAVEAAQAAGKVGRVTGPRVRDIPSPKTFFENERDDVNCRNMARVDDTQFEHVLKEMRASRLMSSTRAATLCSDASGREIKRLKQPEPKPRLEMIQELAEEGHTTRQIATEVGLTVDRVRRLARQNSIVIHADRMTRSSGVNPERVIQETVDALAGLEYGINMLTGADYMALTEERVKEWLPALEGSMRSLNNLRKELKSL